MMRAVKVDQFVINITQVTSLACLMVYQPLFIINAKAILLEEQ